MPKQHLHTCMLGYFTFGVVLLFFLSFFFFFFSELRGGSIIIIFEFLWAGGGQEAEHLIDSVYSLGANQLTYLPSHTKQIHTHKSTHPRTFTYLTFWFDDVVSDFMG